MNNLPELEEIPNVVVIIPTYRREEVFIETLISLSKLTYPSKKLQILIVDQTPIEDHSNQTLDYLRAAEKNGAITWFRPPEITFTSLPKARNVGIEKVKESSDIIIFADDDVEVPQTWVQSHVHAYRSSHYGGVAGRVVTPHHENEINNNRVGSINWFGDFSANYRGDTETDCIDFMGCNFSVRTAALKDSGAFEELIYSRSAIREDSDLAMRIGEAGYLIRFAPKAWCIHKASPTGGTRTEAERIHWYYGWFHDNFLFYAKHAPLWRLPFFILHMSRPILVCWLYYGRGSWRAFVSPWKGIKAGLDTASKSKKGGTAYVTRPTRYPMF